MGMTAAVAFGASAAIGTYSQYKSGKEAQKIANINAGIADQQAQDALARGEREAADYGVKIKQLMGTQTAAYAGQGVMIDAGSPVRVMADTAKYGELDQLTIVNNAKLEAWGLKTQASSMRLEGRYARQRGMFGAGSTILGAVSTFAGKK